jgi:hypothetical protein
MRYLSTISLALVVHVLLSIVVLMALACTAAPATPPPVPAQEPPTLDASAVKDIMRSYLSDQLNRDCIQSLLDGIDDRDCLYRLLDSANNRNCLETLVHGDAEVRKRLKQKPDLGGLGSFYEPLTYSAGFGIGKWSHSWAGNGDEFCRLTVHDKESRVIPPEGSWQWVSDSYVGTHDYYIEGDDLRR